MVGQVWGVGVKGEDVGVGPGGVNGGDTHLFCPEKCFDNGGGNDGTL